MTGFAELIPRLHQAEAEAREIPVALGFDGTVDKIYRVVRERRGLGEAFAAFQTIGDFGEQISAAAGKSAIMELAPDREKIGGNGPICALALSANTRRVTYLGPLGDPIDDAFGPLAEAVERIHPLGDPAVTHALEFEDGKIMLPVLRTYEGVSADRLLEVVGRERLTVIVGEAKLSCLLNWSCLPHMDGIFRLFTETILPACPSDPERLFFFDLADPRKHSADAVRGALQRIRAFGEFGRAVLGLNLSEAQQIARIFDLTEPEADDASLKETATALRELIGLHAVMIHPVTSAACALGGDASYVEGPYTQRPKITTGAGDHLNAGFCLGLLLGWPGEDCLRLGVLFSGYYVRTAHSPSFGDLATFIETELNP